MLDRPMPFGPDLIPLIGREVELERAVHAVERNRLVSLTGPGGSGKTRLAEACITRVQSSGGSASFVDLSNVIDPGLIATSILTALRIDSAEGEPLDAVVSALAGGDTLLVLDNLEQIEGAHVSVSALLAAAPRLRIITTTRVPLRVRGEVEVQLSALALPEGEDPLSVEASPAGAMFLAYARGIGRVEQLDPETAAHIATLLRRLDGLPLAIELAAARTRIMTPAEILRRLDRYGLTAIEASGEGLHRSLAAILDWTLGLLATEQFETLQAVSICAGFDIDLAGALLPQRDVAGALESLVVVGLVAPAGEADGSTRFRILETVRSEAQRRAHEPQMDAYRSRHAAAMVTIADEAWRRIDAGNMLGLDRLDVEADNLRLALDRLETEDPRRGLILWHRLHPFWESRTRLTEGLDRFERLAALAPEPTRELARAATRYAIDVTYVRSDAVARDAMQHAIDVAKAAGDLGSLAEALATQASMAVNNGDLAAASHAAAQLIELSPDLHEPAQLMRVAEVRHYLAGAEHGMSSDEALAPLIEAVELATEANLARSRLSLSGILALVYLYRTEYQKAAASADDAVGLARALRNQYLVAWALSTLAMALAELHEVDRSIDALSEAVALSLAIESPVQDCDRLMAAMPVAFAAGQPLLAAKAWGAALALETSGVDVPPDDRAHAERTMARVRHSSREIDVELAVRDGAGSDPRVLLRAVPDILAERTAPTVASTSLRHGEMTRREIEILGLVGQGRSDPEIAAALFISPKTASVHVANIKAKLGLGSRLEVALKARELGLADDRARSEPG